MKSCQKCANQADLPSDKAGAGVSYENHHQLLTKRERLPFFPEESFVPGRPERKTGAGVFPAAVGRPIGNNKFFELFLKLS